MSVPSIAAAFPPVDQHYLLQARQMQALSFSVHIPLVAFGISFPAIVLFVEWLGHRRGDELYLTLARRWSKVMATLFGVGVITGTALSFEMGILWPKFFGTFGSVFGLGFALEGFSFFLEAIFIGIYIYGWRRLSPRMHLLSGIPIVITGLTGSLLVIAVNAWMNHPGGFALHHGKVVDVHPLTALFGNSFLWQELVHMYVAGYVVSGFIVAACYAFGRLRGRWGRYERTALTIPLTVAALASIIQAPVGDWAARAVGATQPVKLAAMEGLYKTTRGASEHLLGWYTGNQLKYAIPVPHLLSLLADHSWNGKVVGLQSVPASQRPPVNVVHWSFDIMAGIGSLFLLIGVVYVAMWIWRKRLPQSPWFYWTVVMAGPLAVVALISGWVVDEVGRQPWVVYGVMRTDAAVTGAHGIPVSYGALAACYLVVACGLVWVLRRLARAPLELPTETPHQLQAA